MTAEPVHWAVGSAHAPAYVYDLDAVVRAHRALRAALPRPSRLLYSLKANPHPAIVRTLAELGCGAEVSSVGELTAALDAGVAPADIQYTGPGTSAAEVSEAIKAGIGAFSVDSPVGLRRVLDDVEQRRSAADWPPALLLRVNGATPVPGQGLAMTGTTSAFGADTAWVHAAPEAFAGVTGLHLYLGSNLADEAALTAQLETAVATAAATAQALGARPEVLNLGGGFGAPYARQGALPDYPGLAARLGACLDATFPGWRAGHPQVVFEAGRYLTATAGALYTRVADVKDSHGRPVVVLESGINHLGGLSGLRRLPSIEPDIASPADRPRLHRALVTGPLCTPLDTLARAADVPAVRPGDVVMVPNVGAYGLSASLLAFLGHPVPREVVLRAGTVSEVSQLHLVRHDIAATERS